MKNPANDLLRTRSTAYCTCTFKPETKYRLYTTPKWLHISSHLRKNCPTEKVIYTFDNCDYNHVSLLEKNSKKCAIRCAFQRFLLYFVVRHSTASSCPIAVIHNHIVTCVNTASIRMTLISQRNITHLLSTSSSYLSPQRLGHHNHH